MDSAKVNVGGIYFDNVNMDEAIHRVESHIQEYRPDTPGSLLLVANQDIINKVGRYKDLTYTDLNKSFLIIPDGYSIVYGARYLGTPLKERVTGPDLMYNFMKLSNIRPYRHFFLGAAPGVAQKMADHFKTVFPNVVITGIYSPPFGEFTEEENHKIHELVNSAGADVVWVSFGCPKQEWWIVRNADFIHAPVIAGVGAAFDFHSGNKKRAPRIIQSLRLEWLYRVFQEPGRLWKRYFDGGIGFIKILKKQKRG